MATDRPEGEDPRALELALKVADDAPVDWESTRQTAADLSDTLERLQQLQTLGELHRRRDPRAPGKPLFVWGALRVIEKIGSGGFGEVWRAWDPSLEREVALKLRREGDSPAGATRWLREAQRLARVRHAHVLTVHGTDIHDRRAGIWTDLIRGRTLEQVLVEQGPLGPREIVAIGLDLCAALAAVHGAGLIHGDIKTRNVMREGTPIGAMSVAGAGRIVLMDFGTASQHADGGDAPAGATPLFASPELLGGAAPSVASDLYALGVLLYRLASGRFPVEAATLAELRERHKRREVTPLRTWRPDLPGALVQVVEKALAHDPEQRFRSAGDMERALASVFHAPAEATVASVSIKRQIGLLLAGAVICSLTWIGFAWGPGWLKPRFHVVPTGAPVARRLVQDVLGIEASGYLGYTVAAPGDLDGDGIPDLLVGATGENNPNGRVYVLRGERDGHFSKWRTLVSTSGGTFGGRLAALGDIDGDHRLEFAVSAHNDDTPGQQHAGSVYLFHGGAAGGAAMDTVPFMRLEGQRSSGAFGFDVASAGDVNGDGYPDFLVGAVVDDRDGGTAGRAFLYLGDPHPHTKADLVLHPSIPGGQFGYAVAGIGDINGDGFDDWAVGANGDPTIARGSGKVYVYFGSAHPDSIADMSLYAAGKGDWFGASLAGLGDINGDGIDDFAVGAERAMAYEEWGGTISVYLGGQNPSSKPRFVLKGQGGNNKFAHQIAVGDINGDGFPDIISGAYGADDNGPWVGAAYVFYGGPQMDDLPDAEILGNTKSGNFGIDVAYIAGMGGPGGRGLVIGAPDAQPGGEYLVYAYSRFAFTRPHVGSRWQTGGSADLAWIGAERAELEWSPAAGHDWKPLAHRVGGGEQNSLRITVPAAARDSIRLRLRASDPKVPGEAISELIAIDPAR